MQSKKFLGGFAHKTIIKEKLITRLGQIFCYWLLDCILFKNECCKTIPQHIGKMKKEIESFYPKMRYWTAEEYVEFIGLKDELKENEKDIDLPQELVDIMKDRYSNIPYNKIPDFIGTKAQDGKIYVLSLDENERVKDAFYVTINTKAFKTFSSIQLILWAGTIEELEGLGSSPDDMDSHISMVFTIFMK
ncbi:MAG: hypothetical protein LIO97_06535 [Tannerellaceae bacterium]|nr:hypothetical protein [Tannerellaceae bacterium]